MVPLSMTLSDPWPGFQGHVIFWSQIARKWHEIEPYLLYYKSYVLYWMVTFPVTLSDLWPRFQGHGITEGEYLKNGAC